MGLSTHIESFRHFHNVAFCFQPINIYYLKQQSSLFFFLSKWPISIKIEKIAQTFQIEQSIIDKINNDDNVWFSNSEIQVVFKIRKEVANYFLRRKIIPNQIVLKELDDKGLLVSCKVSFDEEILKIVRYWIPNVEIISPDYLKEKLENGLKEYLKI